MRCAIFTVEPLTFVFIATFILIDTFICISTMITGTNVIRIANIITVYAAILVTGVLSISITTFRTIVFAAALFTKSTGTGDGLPF